MIVKPRLAKYFLQWHAARASASPRVRMRLPRIDVADCPCLRISTAVGMVRASYW